MMITVVRYSRGFVLLSLCILYIVNVHFSKKVSIAFVCYNYKKKIYFRRSYDKSRTRNELHGEMLKKKKKKV